MTPYQVGGTDRSPDGVIPGGTHRCSQYCYQSPTPFPLLLTLPKATMCLPLCLGRGGSHSALHSRLTVNPSCGESLRAREDSGSLSGVGYPGVACTSHLDAIGKLGAGHTLWGMLVRDRRLCSPWCGDGTDRKFCRPDALRDLAMLVAGHT